MSGLAWSEHSFESWDGTPLFYRAGRPARPGKGALLLFHRGHEHSGRMVETAERLASGALDVYAWDQRGHGRSPGERGYADDLSVLVRDLDRFVRHLEGTRGVRTEDAVVLGYSVGGVLVTAWVHDFAPRLRGLVLVAPAFRVRLYVPFARTALRMRRALGRRFFVRSYVKSRHVTRDPAEREAYDRDPQIFRQIAGNLLLDLHDASNRLIRDAGAIVAPTLVLSAGTDFVVDVRDQRAFFDRLSSPVKHWRLYPGMRHALLHESGRERVFARIGEFLDEEYAAPPAVRSLVGADRSGFTQREHDELSNPLPHLSLRSGAFAVQRFLLRTAGRASDGIRLGLRTGFDSGESLDYVYANRAAGVLGVGAWLDRGYLNAIGWRGIRRRKENLRALLRVAIDEVARKGGTVRILDPACGGGRYLLEAMLERRDVNLSARLRDASEASLERGRRLARGMGVENATFERGDAFDRRALAAVSPAPNLAVVSGLYELFPENDRVLESLRGIAEAMEGGGVLLYTNQPWHPQLEWIARVLPNRDGRPWVMRRRTQAEMDDLVAAAGFEKAAMEIDPWGIFTVSMARTARA